MKVVLFHDDVGLEAPPDQRDVLVQMEAIELSLRELGHHTERIPCTRDLIAARAAIRASAPDVVFNLVESVAGQGRLISLAPQLLESMGVPYTGCSAAATFLSSSKPEGKRIMAARGIATPAWFGLEELRQGPSIAPGRYIIKSSWEHASIGIDDSAVVHAATAVELAAVLTNRLPLLGGEGFAEAFIEGREFNVSLLCGRVLPVAEIVFENFPANKPRIVGYAAKWSEEAAEYHDTPRRFVDRDIEGLLVDRLSAVAESCWDAFGLRGYARVDFRVDSSGTPWVLEVNSNPCLSPDAGFAAAVSKFGLTYTGAIEQILSDATQRTHVRT